MHYYRRYRTLVMMCPAVLFLYVALALSSLWWPSVLPSRVSGELFPFFKWSLFSAPRRDHNFYTVRVTAVDELSTGAAALVGQTLTDPRTAAFLRDIRFRKVARSLARAYGSKEDAEVERLQTMLDNFLRPYGITEYELVLLTVDALPYYKGTQAAVETVIARFDLGRRR